MPKIFLGIHSQSKVGGIFTSTRRNADPWAWQSSWLSLSVCFYLFARSNAFNFIFGWNCLALSFCSYTGWRRKNWSKTGVFTSKQEWSWNKRFVISFLYQLRTHFICCFYAIPSNLRWNQKVFDSAYSEAYRLLAVQSQSEAPVFLSVIEEFLHQNN